jgi:hypothetical protein
MKAFAPVLMALVAGAKAEAEADPQLLYNTWGSRAVIPSTFGYASTYAGYPYNRVVALGKREAEAEPEADAQLLYGNRFGYTGYNWGLNAYNAYNPYNRVVALGKREAEAEADPQLLYNTWGSRAVIPSTFGYASTYAGYPYNRVVALGKREAEADPQVLLNGWGVSPYVGGHVAYAAPYTHAAVAAPLAAAKPAVGTYTNDAAKFTPAYAMKGQYVAQNAGAVHVAKREAEPEADAQLLYGNRFGYTGYNWGLNAYSAYNPYNRVVALGKREAEADPALIYSTNAWGVSPYTYSAGYPYASSIYGINRFY